jgi:hypothetical protein
LTNLIAGTAESVGDHSILQTDLGNWTVKDISQGEGLVLIRPDRVILGPAARSQTCELAGKLTDTSFSGQIIQVQLEIDSEQLNFFLTDLDQKLPKIGSQITLSFNPDLALQFFPEN